MGASTVRDSVARVYFDARLHVLIEIHVLRAFANDFLVMRATGAVGTKGLTFCGHSSEQNSLRTPAVVMIAQVWSVAPAVLVHFLAVLTDASVAAVCVAALQRSANVVVVGALVEIVAGFLVFRQPETMWAGTLVTAFNIVTRMTALVAPMFTLVLVNTFLRLRVESRWASTFFFTANDMTISRATVLMIVWRALDNRFRFFRFFVHVVVLVVISPVFHFNCFSNNIIFFACLVIVSQSEAGGTSA